MNLPDPAAYRDRIMAGVTEAIIVNSITEVEGVKTSMVMSGEVIDVMLTTIAAFAAGSEACASPVKTRKLCDEFARKLQRRIAEARNMNTGFEHIHLGEAQ